MNRRLVILCAGVLLCLGLGFLVFGNKGKLKAWVSGEGQSSDVIQKTRASRSDAQQKREGFVLNKPDTGKDRSDDVARLVNDESLNNADTAKMLFEIVADNSANMASRLEALDNAMNLLDWNNKNELSSVYSIIERPEIPVPVVEGIFTRCLNAPPKVSLNVAVKLVNHKNEELATEARELLEHFTEEEHGTDSGAWQKAVEGFLLKKEQAPQAQPVPTAPASDPNKLPGLGGPLPAK